MSACICEFDIDQKGSVPRLHSKEFRRHFMYVEPIISANTDHVLSRLCWHFFVHGSDITITKLSQSFHKYVPLGYGLGLHYTGVNMSAMGSQITSLTIYYSTVYSGADKKSKLRVTGHCEGNSPVNSPHQWLVTRKMFPFDDVIKAHTGGHPWIPSTS